MSDVLEGGNSASFQDQHVNPSVKPPCRASSLSLLILLNELKHSDFLESEPGLTPQSDY